MLLATCGGPVGQISGVIIADGCDVLSRVLAVGLSHSWKQADQNGARSADLTHIYTCMLRKGACMHTSRELKGLCPLTCLLSHNSAPLFGWMRFCRMKTHSRRHRLTDIQTSKITVSIRSTCIMYKVANSISFIPVL